MKSIVMAGVRVHHRVDQVPATHHVNIAKSADADLISRER